MSTATKFKVGDRIRVVGAADWYTGHEDIGKEGRVVCNIYSDRYAILVKNSAYSLHSKHVGGKDIEYTWALRASDIKLFSPQLLFSFMDE